MAGDKTLPWKQVKAAKEERRRYEESRQRRKHERQHERQTPPQNNLGGTRGDWGREGVYLSQLPVLTVGSV